MQPDMTEEDVHAHLLGIGVSLITQVSKLGSDTPTTTSAFRVRINDDSIKNNVYNRENFERGIFVKPFRFRNITPHTPNPRTVLLPNPTVHNNSTKMKNDIRPNTRAVS